MWRRLAETVNLIVDSAWSTRFPTARCSGPTSRAPRHGLIESRLPPKIKPLHPRVNRRRGIRDRKPSAFAEDADIPGVSPTRTVDGGWASGYGTSSGPVRCCCAGRATCARAGRGVSR